MERGRVGEREKSRRSDRVMGGGGGGKEIFMVSCVHM